MRRTLNVKLFLGLPILVLLMGGGVHLLHGYQVKRNAGSLLEQADKAVADGDPAKAAQYLERYLGFVPTDLDAQARYGGLLQELATTGGGKLRAFFVLEAVLRSDPGRQDVRRKLVDLSMGLGRLTDAREHLISLCRVVPDDAELEEKFAKVEEASGKYAQAAEWYEKAARHDPKRTECFVRLAYLYRRKLDKPELGDQTMEALVAAHPQSAAAFLDKARYAREFLSLDRAEAAVAAARKLAPNDVDAIMAAADLAMARNRAADARALLREGMEKHPKNPALVQMMARLELLGGQRESAAKFARQSLDVVPGDARSMWTVADLLIDSGELAEAKGLIGKIDGTTLPAGAVDYLQARLHFAEGDWGVARTRLEKARGAMVNTPSMLKQVHLLLALCHQRLGNPDQQLASYRHALDLDANWMPARLGLAAALLAVGRVDDAMAMYDKLAPESAEARLQAVRLHALRAAQRPLAQRNWSDLEKALNDLPAEEQGSMGWRLQRAELLLSQDKFAEAETVLKQAAADFPDATEPRIGLAVVALRKGTPSDAAAALDVAEKALGDRVEIRLARARLQTGGSDSKQLIERLLNGAERFKSEEQVRLFNGLAAAAVREEQLPLARSIVTKLTQLQPAEVSHRFLAVELALRTDDKDAVPGLLAELRKTEGEDGPLWRYCEAVKIVRFAPREGDKGWIKPTRELVLEAAKRRPSWAPLAILEAELDEREGNTDAAIEHLRKAVELGDQRSGVVRRLVMLLQERRRYADAQEVLRRIPERTVLTDDLTRLAAETSLTSQAPPEKTLELARQAVKDNSTDYRDHLWLGQILAATKQTAEAEKALRKATELGADTPEAWAGLILFLARSGQKSEAEAAIRDAAAKLGDKAGLVLAVGYEAIGRLDQAEQQYQAALKAKPDDPAALRDLSGLYLRAGQLTRAEPVLRQLLKVGDGTSGTWARRHLALSLAFSGDFSRFQEALRLVDENLRVPNPAVEDQRARAVVLATQPSRRKESIRALEESFARVPATPQERFLLARLYELDQDWPKARAQMLDLLTNTSDRNADHLAHMIVALARHGEPDAAEPWLDELLKIAPGSWRSIEAVVRVRVAQKRQAEAKRVLESVNPSAEADLPLRLAALADESGFPDLAEKVLRSFMAVNPRSDRRLPLASYLARWGRITEALDLCEAGDPHAPPEVTAMSVSAVVRSPKVTPADLKRADAWLTAAAKRKPDSPMVLLAVADLKDRMADYAGAEASFRRVLELEPKNALAANNLAALLAMRKQGPEALRWVARSMELSGPLPALLDTRAMALLANGQPDQAVTDLEEAVALGPNAMAYFHLAQALAAAKNKPAAIAAFEKAQALGLKPDDLHPLERAALEELTEQLAKR